MSQDRTSPMHGDSTEPPPAPAPAATRAPKLRPLPPRPGSRLPPSLGGRDHSQSTAGPSLQIITYAYPIVGIVLISGLGLVGWLVGSAPAAQRDTTNTDNAFLSQLQNLRPVAPVERYQPVHHDNHTASETRDPKPSPDAASPDLTRAPADIPDGNDPATNPMQLLKLLQEVKRPSTPRKDLAQLRKLLAALKKKKGAVKGDSAAQLRDLLKSLKGSAAPVGAADVAELQALLSRLEKSSDATRLRDVQELRDLLNRLAGRNAPIDPDDPQAVKDLLTEIVPDASAIKPEDLERLQQLLKQASSKDGSLDLADVQKLHDVLAQAAAGNSAAELQNAGPLSAILQDATGKPPARSLDYLSRLQEAAGDGTAPPPALGLSQLSDLRNDLANSTGDRPALQTGDLDNFAKLVKARTGPDGKVGMEDAHEALEVLKDLTGKKASPYVDFLTTVSGADEDPASPQPAPGLDDVKQVDSLLTSLAGDGTGQKLQSLDPTSLRQLGEIVQDLTRKSGEADPKGAAKLAALIERATGSPAKVAPPDLTRLRDLLVRKLSAKQSTKQQTTKAPTIPELWAGRPKFPKNLFSPASRAETVSIDLASKDLGHLISNEDWPDGTVFIVSGFGVRLSSPLTVQGKSLRLHFRQTRGDPLVIVPRAGISRSPATGAPTFDDAFISVRNGSLEIVDGMIGVSAYEQLGINSLPRWMIQVVNGNLSLQHCRLLGPAAGTTRNKGLVQWLQTPAGRSADRADKTYAEQACLVDTFLAGNGTLIDGDVRQRALFVHNCVAAGSQVLSLNLAGADATIAGAVDLEHSTLAAYGAVFHVQANPAATQSERPLQVFSNHCLFASPFKSGGKSRPCTLLKYAAPALAQKQITWREYANGYSADVRHYLQGHAEKVPTEQTIAAWVGAWGADRIQRPLTGPNAVRFARELPRRARLSAAHFELDANCAAAGWGDEGSTLGADIEQIDYASGLTSQPSIPQREQPLTSAPQF